MKLNKSQRYTLYVILLKEAKRLKKFDFYGVCNLMQNITGLHPCGYMTTCSYLNPILYKDSIPEFYNNAEKFRGKIGHIFWWNTTKKGWEKRIELLEYCIKLTEDG